MLGVLWPNYRLERYRVPRSLVDFIVTEEGVLSTKNWVPGKNVLNKTRERNEG